MSKLKDLTTFAPSYQKLVLMEYKTQRASI